MTEDILGYNVQASSARDCVLEIVESVHERKKSVWLACLNPHSYAVAINDILFRKALCSADWLVPDGIGIVHASMLLGGVLKERITGSDIFYGLHDQLSAQGGATVFFLGSTNDTLRAIVAKMAIDYPLLRVVGLYSPPFSESFSLEEQERMCSAINMVKPDILWVGLTAPKQEKWIYENVKKLDVGFVGAVGAVFDFYVGNVRRSHPVFQRFGLEWLPRLLQQPKRLWRRMFVSAPIFVFHIVIEKFRRLFIG